jgi:hypothetical protein
MEITQEQKLNAQIIQRAWDDAKFKSELLANPVEVMEKLTGRKLNLQEGQKLVVVDQTNESTVYFNIPKKVDLETLELTQEQLEMVAGGLTPTFLALGYGIMAGVAIYAATKD